MALITFDVIDGIVRSGSMIMLALVLLSATLVLIASIDVPYQLWSHNKQMRMTKQEVKDESKETDGRPEVKARIKQLQREASQRRMLQDVPDADVIITNPRITPWRSNMISLARVHLRSLQKVRT